MIIPLHAPGIGPMLDKAAWLTLPLVFYTSHWVGMCHGAKRPVPYNWTLMHCWAAGTCLGCWLAVLV